jgi:hypothetical protein
MNREFHENHRPFALQSSIEESLKPMKIRKKQSITFLQLGEGHAATEISVHLNKFTALMASEEKTFAYLNRGAPFEDVFAVSGYSQGDFGGAKQWHIALKTGRKWIIIGGPGATTLVTQRNKSWLIFCRSIRHYRTN